MNPFGLSATGLVVWGLVAHLIADWLLQNEWMALNKVWPWRWSIAGLAPAFVHGGIHLVALGLVLGYWPAVVLAAAHIFIDTRLPVAWWSRLIRQTQPKRQYAETHELQWKVPLPPTVLDIGAEVRIWNDQVWHIACIAIAALVAA